MELADFTKVFDRLLPRGRTWNLLFDRPMKKFFNALSSVPVAIRDHVGSILLDAFPQSTDRLQNWTSQFASPSTLSISELEAEFANTGGQNPYYFQAILHAAGFTTCFIHEWWVPNSDPVEYRNPIALVDTSRVLVNDISHIQKKYKWQCGDNVTQCVADNSIRCGDYEGYHLVQKPYPCPDIETQYPDYFYVCGETWPEYALVGESKLRKLIRLIYKMKPMHLRCILRVTTYDDSGETPEDYDIQDTWWHPIIFTDHVEDPDPEETIQDYY